MEGYAFFCIKDMYLRTSQALVVCPDSGQTIGFNFLRQTSFVCSAEILKLLHHTNDWQPASSLYDLFPEFSEHDVDESIDDLVDVGGLVVKDSEYDQEERKKIGEWDWGIPSALLHYGEQNRQYVSQETAEEIQKERVKAKAKPQLFSTNEAFEDAVELKRPLAENGVLDLMARRRTVREVNQTNIPIEVLSDCLFAGMGITSTVKNCVTDLPLSMTPSGGARNPYEAYVYAPRVEGLSPGFYHYSAIEHSLGKISDTVLNNAAELVGDQAWINDMSAIVFLCADFERTMWKYQDNNAYRVVLIEAGHIGQNIMLAATENGLTACPSAALAHTKISSLLELDGDLKSPIYALMIGCPTMQEHSDLH